jgi:hypothetical protein
VSAAVTVVSEDSTNTSVAQIGVSQRFASFVPALVGVLGAWVALLSSGTPIGAVFAYTLYFGLAVVLPGTLLYRCIAGFSDSLLSDVAWGAVTGLMLELVGWAAFTALGMNRYLWLWPTLVVLTFALVPRLRSLWRRPYGSGRTGRVIAWATSLSSLLGCVYLAANYYRFNRLPPNGGGYFVDLPWHLGVAFEATRSVPLRIPEASAEGILSYHWFADAHFAAASLISGVDLPTVVVRTGLFPLVFVLVAATACLAIKITGRPGVGALAAVLVVATTAGAEYWTRLYKMRVLYPESPTAIYAVGISCLVMAVLVDLSRKKSLSRPRLALFVVALFAAVGSKPSVLLVFAPAVGLVLGLELVHRRRLNRSVVWAFALMAVAVLVSIPLFASPSGSTIRLSLRQVQVWRTNSGTSTPVLMITALVKGYLPALTAAVALCSRRLRSDPAARLLGAVTLVGFVAAWAIDHPGLSQTFFWTTAIPFAEILSAWGLALALDAVAARRRQVFAFAAVTGATVLVSMVSVRAVTDGKSAVLPGWIALVSAALVIMLVGHLLRIPFPIRFLIAALGAIAISVPVSLMVIPLQPLPGKPNSHILAESEAAHWVANNTPVGDQLATNSHCLGPTRPHCDARSFWLSGFGGRRVLLGGYGVSPAALSQSRVDGYPAWRQPYHDQDLYRLNDGAFEAPDATSLRRLYDQYDVRWLVSDRYAGPVSPLLDRLAELRYANEWVRIYKLDPALLKQAP